MANVPSIDSDAWILDATVHREGILLWLKMPSGEVIAAVYPYYLAFYAVLPQSHPINPALVPESRENEYRRWAISLQTHPQIREVRLCQRRIQAEDANFGTVLRIETDSPLHFKPVVQWVRSMETFALFNTDLPLVQIFFYETHLFPFALCHFQIKRHKSLYKIVSAILKDSNEKIHYNMPPLRVIWLEIEADTRRLMINKTDTLKSCRITVDPCSVPLSLATHTNPGILETDSHGVPQLVLRHSSERELLLLLQNIILSLDPDVIFTSHGDEELFPYLLARASYQKIDHIFTLSRDRTPLIHTRFQVEGSSSFMSYGIVMHRSPSQFYLNGRLHIDSAIYGGLHFDDGNLYGIAEVARVSYTPLQRLTRITIGGSLQSLQFFHAYAQNILIPEEKKNAEYFQKSTALLFSDRGGHILQPQIGLFERVAELDFTSMYPSLMCEYNVSPETLNCPCCKETGIRVPGLSYYLCRKRPGIVPLSLQIPLMKRIRYKELAKTTKGSEAIKYKKMEEALKWILVVCFGYLGFRNARFGRIEAHQTVCAFAREFLLNATEIIERHGFHAIHGIVDCLWIQAPTTTDSLTFDTECLKIVHEIQERTHIPIGYDPRKDRYEFINFLPTKQIAEIGALNRYWGKKVDGTFKVRGVELRRHDAPPFIKQFQEELMATIGQVPVEHRTQVPLLLNRHILPLLIRYYELLESRKASADELAISLRLTRRPDQYKVQNYQAIASTYLERLGAPTYPGQKISFIITNDGASNPQERVMPLALYKQVDRSYDIHKYKELLVRALINLLPFYISPVLRQKLERLSVVDFNKSHFMQTTLKAFLQPAKNS